MTKRIKYIASAILPLLQERVGVRLLGALLLLLTACSSSDDAVTESLGTEDAIVLGVKEEGRYNLKSVNARVKTLAEKSEHIVILS